jgi:hypothetical protein
MINGGQKQLSNKKIDYNELHHTHDDHIDHDEHHDLHTERALAERFALVDIETLRMQAQTIDVKDKSGNPAVLGLLGFGLTTFLLNMHNAGVFPLSSMI